MNRCTPICAAASVIASVMAIAHAQAAGPADPAKACAALAAFDFTRIPDAATRISSATSVPAADNQPAVCRVLGYVTPNVGIEMRLPDATWNGKLYHGGCGGLCGSTAVMLDEFRAGDEALARGYAIVASDMGHRGASVLDGQWARGNPAAQIDFAYRATHVATLAAKAIVERFYGTAAQRTYFEGCSTGGRQGLMEAQRFPADFDGIIVGCPILSQATESVHVAWSVRANLDARGQPILKDEQLPLLHSAMIAACDARDGAKDGMIADPRACNFDPNRMRCKAKTTADCLTPIQVDAVRKLYQGARNSRGEALTPGGAVVGSELEWAEAFVSAGSEQPFEERLANEYLTQLGLFDASVRAPGVRELNFDRDPPRLALSDALSNASNPDLRAFRERGGRLILHQGWSDPSTAALSTLDYYETVTRVMGGREQVGEFARLYLLPGVGHCGGGKGADVVDFLSALEAWVEREVVPDLLVGYHILGEVDPGAQRFPVDPAQVAFSRPQYPYPAFARYSGKGEMRDYKNWVKAGVPVPKR
jgi:hypothetical protein